MSNDTKEQLSALMDGEASELELHRVLKEIPQDPELFASWQRYHLCRSVIRGELRGADQSLVRQDLTGRISAAIVNEPEWTVDRSASDHESAKKRGIQNWTETLLKPFASVAIAASVSAVVVIGWQTLQPAGEARHPQTVAVPALASQNQTFISVEPQRYGYSSAMPVAQTHSHQSRPTISDENIIRMPQQENRLTKYLISHSGNSAFATANGAMSYARVVNLKPETK